MRRSKYVKSVIAMVERERSQLEYEYTKKIMDLKAMSIRQEIEAVDDSNIDLHYYKMDYSYLHGRLNRKIKRIRNKYERDLRKLLKEVDMKEAEIYNNGSNCIEEFDKC